MKKIKMILSLAALLVTLSGCANQEPQNNDNQTNNDNTTTEASTDNNDNTAEANANNIDNTVSNSDPQNVDSNKTDGTNNTSSQNTSKETSKDEQSFYGDWQIIKDIGHSRIHGGEDDSKVIGLKMKFSNNEAIICDQNFQTPKYTLTTISKEDFVKEFRYEPSELGLLKGNITLFEVHSTGVKPKTSPAIIVKDNDTLIYNNEGVFFNVKRVP